jgi:uncharacterized RDD family membrane protein YckC
MPPPTSPFGALPTFSGVVASQSAYAGFWIRWVAYMIDGAIFLISFQIVAVIRPSWLASLLGFIILLGYLANAIYLTSVGGTLGQRVCRLRVVDARDDKSNIGLARSVLRFIGFIISSLVFDLGLIWVAFDSEKQGWHDKMAQTHVVHKMSHG